MSASGTSPDPIAAANAAVTRDTAPASENGDARVDSPSTDAARLHLQAVDLRSDPAATVFVKDEVVSVVFASLPGELQSLEGPNAYQVGDALVQASSGERWVVSRDRFDPKYLPADPALPHGTDGAYRNRPVPVLAKRMTQAFTIARSAGGDYLHGVAGDWLLQYAPADYGVVQQTRFARVYRAVSQDGATPQQDAPVGGRPA